MEKIILFIIVIIKPNKDNSPILENFASHKKSITSFFSLHLSPNPIPFIMVAFVKFPVIIIFLYKKISEIHEIEISHSQSCSFMKVLCRYVQYLS